MLEDKCEGVRLEVATWVDSDCGALFTMLGELECLYRLIHFSKCLYGSLYQRGTSLFYRP